jgi:hypothetical protein
MKGVKGVFGSKNNDYIKAVKSAKEALEYVR